MGSGKSSILMGFLLAWMLSSLLSPLAEAADRVVVIPMGSGGKPLQNIVTVAKSKGQFTDPVAAMNSITDASFTNPYLLYIGPGQYTLTTALAMKPFVNVTGSGEQVTWLIGNISSDAADETSAIVKGANNAALSNLSVSNTGGGEYSIGIFTTGLDLTARLENVSVYAKGGIANVGVMNLNYSSPMMTGLNIAVEGTGTQVNVGIYNIIHSSPPILGVKILVWGGQTAYGIVNNSFSVPLIEGSNIYAWDSSAFNVGILNAESNEVKIKRSTISGTSIGLSNGGGSINTRVSQSTLINGASGSGYTCIATDNNLGQQYTINCSLL